MQYVLSTSRPHYACFEEPTGPQRCCVPGTRCYCSFQPTTDRDVLVHVVNAHRSPRSSPRSLTTVIIIISSSSNKQQPQQHIKYFRNTLHFLLGILPPALTWYARAEIVVRAYRLPQELLPTRRLLLPTDRCPSQPAPSILLFGSPIVTNIPISNCCCVVATKGEREALAEGAAADSVPALLPAVPVLLNPAVGGGAVRRDHPQVPRVACGAAALPRHGSAACPGEPVAGEAASAARAGGTFILGLRSPLTRVEGGGATDGGVSSLLLV